jgi:putative copper resistance protein D
MGPDPQIALRLCTALLNLAVAVLTGAGMSRLWLGRGTSSWARARRRSVRGAAIGGAVVALAANLVLVWLESAAMAEVAPLDAGPATWTMLRSTHLGLAWAIGMIGLVVATTGACMRPGRDLGSARLILGGLAVFWYTRSMVSHASSEGDFSLPMLADWLHQGLISLWVGEVILAGCIMLAGTGDLAPADRRARAAWVASLSDSATLALAGIFATGLYASWRDLGGFGNLFGNPYGSTLAAKLVLVGAAVLLGGFNRFCVMPPWLARESAGQAAPALLPARFRQVLWIEGLVLLAVVVAAAWLASTSPPGELPS